MTRLVVNIQLLSDVVNFLTVVVLNSFFDIPLNYLAINKQSGVSVATTVKGSVQRPKTQLWLTYDYFALVFILVVEQVVQTVNSDNGTGWRQLTVGNEVLAVR